MIFYLIDNFGVVMSEVDVTYEKRIVAFIDILGFKDLIEGTINSDDSINNAKVKDLQDAFELVYSTIKKHLPETIDNIKISTFSDCIVISFPVNQEDSLFYLMLPFLWIHVDLLQYNILLRGAITRGLILHTDKMVFGPAMVRAYELESRNAIAPRIIVDSIVLDKQIEWLESVRDAEEIYAIKNELKSLIADGRHGILSLDKSLGSKEDENYYFIDYISKSQSEFDDPEIGFKYLIGKLNELTIIGLKNDDIKVAQKYTWLNEKIKPYLSVLG